MKTAKPSQHMGTVGEKAVFDLVLISKRSFDHEDDWGDVLYTKWLHRMADKWGNIFIWWGSHELKYADTPKTEGSILEPGECITVEAIVKEHEFYDGERQTKLSHVGELQTKEQKSELRKHRAVKKRADLVAAGICPDCKGQGKKRGKVCESCKGGW